MVGCPTSAMFCKNIEETSRLQMAEKDKKEESIQNQLKAYKKSLSWDWKERREEAIMESNLQAIGTVLAHVPSTD